MRCKKGELGMNMLVPGILMLVIAGFVLVMGLIMLDELLLDVADTSSTTYNETLTTVAETGETVTNAGSCGFHNFVVSEVFNASSADPINSGNYTVDARQGIVYASGATIWNNTDWNVTYSYDSSTSEACSGTNTTLDALGDFGDYIDLIVLGVVLAVIISLVMWGFARRSIR
jgi:hypothetical protein